MSLRCLSFVVSALCAGVVAAEPPAATVLVNHNPRLASAKGAYFHNFPQDSLPRAGKWLGLFCSKSDCEVREAAVTVLSGTVPNCDDGEAYAETVHASGNPVAVFHGLELPAGRAPTALLATKELLGSPQFKRLRKLGHWQAQLKGKSLSISWVRMQLPKSSGEYQYRYHLGDGATKQFVFSSLGRKDTEAGGAVTPFVHWAGDLDGDGKIDLLMEIPYHMAEADSCEVSYRLYLSSRAAEGEVLHKVAQTSGQKPACGC